MSRHGQDRHADRPGRRGGARYAAARPGVSRRVAVAASGSVLAVSGLGAAGVLPLLPTPPEVGIEALAQPVPPEASGGGSAASTALAAEPSAAAAADEDPAAKPPATAALPADSGAGRRVVYDISDQQVWLVDDAETVVRTYKVSGSRYDQVEPGTYEVYSASPHATGWHGTETMEHMVRFTRGQRAAIGFHSIPVVADTGEPLQSLAELGTPLSDGCVRQAPDDAAALYDFAPVGTTVVVTR